MAVVLAGLCGYWFSQVTGSEVKDDAGQNLTLALNLQRVPAGELPREFTLDDSMGMAPGAKLSGAAAVIVEARVSRSGNALPQSGDFSGKSAPVKPGAAGVQVIIDRVVP